MLGWAGGAPYGCGVPPNAQAERPESAPTDEPVSLALGIRHCPGIYRDDCRQGVQAENGLDVRHARADPRAPPNCGKHSPKPIVLAHALMLLSVANKFRRKPSGTHLLMWLRRAMRTIDRTRATIEGRLTSR